MPLRVLTLFCILLFSACAPKQKAIHVHTPNEAKLAWQAFVSGAKEQADKPFRVEASLRYSGANNKGARVSSILWGNGQRTMPYPLRLDLTAGFGTVVAKVQEDIHTFIVYSPQEKTAYTSSKSNNNFISFGVPIPINLADVSFLLTGHNDILFLPHTKEDTQPNVVSFTAEGICFDVSKAKLSGIVELSPTGSVLSWQDGQTPGWHIYFENDKKNPSQPKKITIQHAKGYEAILTVKDISFFDTPFIKTQLSLLIPAGTTKKELEVK